MIAHRPRGPKRIRKHIVKDQPKIVHKDIDEDEIQKVVDKTFNFGFDDAPNYETVINKPMPAPFSHPKTPVVNPENPWAGKFSNSELHKMATQAAWEAPIIAAVANAVEPGTGALIMTAAENLAKADRRANAQKLLGPDDPYLPIYLGHVA